MNCDFIEIGTSNFDTLIESCSDDEVGLSVEPLSNYLDDLPDKPNVIKAPLAVSNQRGELDMYYVPPDVVEKYFPGRNGLKGCSSLGKPHPTAVQDMNSRGIGHLIKTKKVPVITFGDLLDKFDVKSIRYLKTDTEGHDCIILQNLLDIYHERNIPQDSPLWPDKILFESNILTSKELINKTIDGFESQGYIIKSQTDTDTVLVRNIDDPNKEIYRILVLAYDLSNPEQSSQARKLLELIEQLSNVDLDNKILQIRTSSNELGIPETSKFFDEVYGPDLIISHKLAIKQAKIICRGLNIPLITIVHDNLEEYYQFMAPEINLDPELICCGSKLIESQVKSKTQIPTLSLDENWLDPKSLFWNPLLWRISIVVPCHGEHVSHLPQLIKTFEAFLIKPDEVIISISLAPNQSADQVTHLLAELKGDTELNLKLHLSFQPLTASQNRNLGAKQAKGDILLFLDADDKYHVQLTQIVRHIWKTYSPADLHWYQSLNLGYENKSYIDQQYSMDDLDIIFGEESYRLHHHDKSSVFKPWSWNGEDRPIPALTKAHSAVARSVWEKYPWPEIVLKEDRLYSHQVCWAYPDSCLRVKAVLSIYHHEHSIGLNNHNLVSNNPPILIDKLGRTWKYHHKQDIPRYDFWYCPDRTIDQLLELAESFIPCKSFGVGGWFKITSDQTKLDYREGHGIYTLVDDHLKEHYPLRDNEKPIPKTIHQIWIGPKPKPNCYMDSYSKDYIDRFPDWKYMFWGDKEIDELDMPTYLRELYNQEPEYRGKADIARIYILYKYGGLYIDADAVWVNDKCYDELIDQSKSTGLFAGKSPSDDFIQNKFIGTYVKNPHIKYLMEEVLPQVYKPEKRHLPNTVIGPVMWNLLVEEGRPFTIFPHRYFYPFSWKGNNDPKKHEKFDIPEDSYAFHYGISTNNLKYY